MSNVSRIKQLRNPEIDSTPLPLLRPAIRADYWIRRIQERILPTERFKGTIAWITIAFVGAIVFTYYG